MLKFITWRLIEFPIALGIIYLVTFLLAWVVPGSPFGNNDRKLDPAAKLALQQRFHADKVTHFLAYYPAEIIRHGDLGPSMFYEGFTVNEILAACLPVSMALGMCAIFIALIAGSAVGVLAALRRGGILDYASLAVALIGISLPSFVVAGLLIAIFTDRLHWLPGGGWGTLRHLILPSVALATLPMAYIARLTRVSMLDTLGHDFIRTARAKGLTRSRVVWRHAFRNAFLPVFTYLGPATAYAITGSFVIETVFNIPGLGQHFVNAVKNRDQTLILGTVLVYAAILLALNLVVDIGYALIDPRIDVTEKNIT